ncbi:MAG TPA: aminodeoxychorismate synthase component I [Pyrinomonadaceae bacterium]|nr:aminodeoxychorismate synthase component I [Pyrinomonadaceae bacterium]
MKSNAPVVTREISLSAEELLGALLNMDASRRVSILDSCGYRPPEARFLIAGFDPAEIIEAHGDEISISRASRTEVMRGDVLALLDERLESRRVTHFEQSLPAAGACIASFSYDLARQFERLRSRAPHASTREPDAVLAFYDTLVIHDYLQGSTSLVSVAAEERLDEFHEALSDAARACDTFHLEDSSQTRAARSNFTREEYLSAVSRIKEHIAAGDIYQANLTQQLHVPLYSSSESVFLKLRRAHPASFAAFLRRGRDVVISASPERFLRVEAQADGRRVVEAWPIKGTRPRGQHAEEDRRLRAELLQSEKDRAENVMIVDLLRNDLGRVCRYGTVHVPELFTVQEHPTLFHLVSRVRGLLREDVRVAELMRATFPCGSITGAPKLRAMEILDEIEPARRGLSMGAIGYFSFDGRADLSVAIRTMTVEDGEARFNVGGGIVADSLPEDEYQESLVKARALLRALDAKL